MAIEGKVIKARAMTEYKLKNGEAIGNGILVRGPESDPSPDPVLDHALRTVAKFMMLHVSDHSQDELAGDFTTLLDKYKNKAIVENCKKIFLTEAKIHRYCPREFMECLNCSS